MLIVCLIRSPSISPFPISLLRLGWCWVRLVSLALGNYRPESAQSRRLEAWTTASVAPCPPVLQRHARCTCLWLAHRGAAMGALWRGTCAIGTDSQPGFLPFGEVTFGYDLASALFPFFLRQPGQSSFCILRFIFSALFIIDRVTVFSSSPALLRRCRLSTLL